MRVCAPFLEDAMTKLLKIALFSNVCKYFQELTQCYNFMSKHFDMFFERVNEYVRGKKVFLDLYATLSEMLQVTYECNGVQTSMKFS